MGQPEAAGEHGLPGAVVGGEDPPDPAAGRVVVVGLQRQGRLAAVHGAGEEMQFSHGARSCHTVGDVTLTADLGRRAVVAPRRGHRPGRALPDGRAARSRGARRRPHPRCGVRRHGHRARERARRPGGRARASPAARRRTCSWRPCARAGVSNDVPVVVYDDWQGRAAGRAWWLLRDYGHPTCGCSTVAGRPGSRPAVRSRPSSRTPVPGRLRRHARRVAGGRRRRAWPTSDVLIDARAPERYRGDVEPIDPVAGHIPGAVNVDTSRNLADGRHLPVGAPSSASSMQRSAPYRARTWRPTAAPASPRPTTCWRWRWPAWTRRSTRGAGRDGWRRR